MLAPRLCAAAALLVVASCAKQPAETQSAPSGAASAGATTTGATSTTTAAASAPTSGRLSRNPTVISREELQDPVIAGSDAMNAIRQLRPAFFRDRGPRSMPRNSSAAAEAKAAAAGKVQISQDFGPLQPVTALNNLEVRTLIEIRYLDAPEAQARFGINANAGPVIVLLTSRQ